MQKKTVRRFFKWLQIVAAIYVVCGVALYFLQEKFIFHPQKLPAGHTFNFAQPFQEVYLPVNDDKNISIVRFTVPDSLCKGVVLYFHGNRNNIERYAAYASSFTRNNYEVWMMDYPGFGKSTGDRSEEILYSDALLFYKMARAKFGTDSIILYGKSLGSGIAAQLASIRDCKKLILETPYSSMDDLASHWAFMYPVTWMLHYHLPTDEYLPQIKVPITILHGTKDEIIPFSHAKHLATIARPGTELIPIEGGKHNNLSEFAVFQRKMDSLLFDGR
ncbi:MAG: alpha/beta fold hydrolase [Chitinophagaceae bacterium]|nr:MAG: alpha/beta fold hydrolase [Chitinophagaceae bacterium]